LSNDCAIQDLLVLDLKQPELAELVELGNRECGFHFPSDVTEEWGAAAAPGGAAANRVEPTVPDELAGEGDHSRALLWGGFQHDKPPSQAARLATLLPDGTWSCGPMLKPDQVNRTSPPRCK
jgi:hypothetical protein